MEKKVGVTGQFEIFFQKTAFAYSNTLTKTGMLFGQTFDGEPPRNLRPAGGVKHSDSGLVETGMLSAKKALR